LTEFHLESLQADWLSTRRTRITYRLVVGLLGLVFGLFFGLIDLQLAEKFAWSWKESRKGLAVGLFYGLVVGLGGGLFFGLGFGLSGVPLTKNVRLKPNQGIHTSGWNALRLGLLFFLFFGLVVGPVVGLFGGLRGGLFGGLRSGLFGGVVFGLVVGLVFGGGAYFRHYVLRLFLAQSRALPWTAVPFLEEVKRCILLQRVGGGYRFVHPLLQEYFASLTLSLTT
jgi:MFS family permease